MELKQKVVEQKVKLWKQRQESQMVNPIECEAFEYFSFFIIPAVSKKRVKD